ncbi:MAG: hypothetical protein KZQ76_12595 [Candidatus Thiodiazotropha sp. (ex Epidulcina cf. delphinae)]|nr:hypothetical protein [Candidatus Thiodiazotropha sp. (ex Epidulcina cf. delphinae)]
MNNSHNDGTTVTTLNDISAAFDATQLARGDYTLQILKSHDDGADITTLHDIVADLTVQPITLTQAGHTGLIGNRALTNA